MRGDADVSAAIMQMLGNGVGPGRACTGRVRAWALLQSAASVAAASRSGTTGRTMQEEKPVGEEASGAAAAASRAHGFQRISSRLVHARASECKRDGGRRRDWRKTPSLEDVFFFGPRPVEKKRARLQPELETRARAGSPVLLNTCVGWISPGRSLYDLGFLCP